eukprot:gb/GECH01002855.1/.p1 GENE.gb/GECH01002855.1/~~gb/GECH01002855.1/.p1  ORF type:complete len:228 (+),score=50.53 gb/GECH01002855.1/:1-684(+)
MFFFKLNPQQNLSFQKHNFISSHRVNVNSSLSSLSFKNETSFNNFTSQKYFYSTTTNLNFKKSKLNTHPIINQNKNRLVINDSIFKSNHYYSHPTILIKEQQHYFSTTTLTTYSSNNHNNMSDVDGSVCLVTAGSREEAKKLAGGLVTEKLAACVNIVPNITSVYTWEGKVEEDPEILMIIKTKTNLVSELAEWVKKNHSYDTPEVISYKISNGLPDYLSWLGEVTK